MHTVKYRGRCNLLPVTGLISAVSIIPLRYCAFNFKDSINKNKIGISPINRNMGYGDKSKGIFQ